MNVQLRMLACPEYRKWLTITNLIVTHYFVWCVYVYTRCTRQRSMSFSIAPPQLKLNLAVSTKLPGHQVSKTQPVSAPPPSTGLQIHTISLIIFKICIMLVYVCERVLENVRVYVVG